METKLQDSEHKQQNTAETVERVPAYLPYMRGVTDKIGHLLRRKYSIRTIFRPLTQMRRILRSPKDRTPLEGPGVYEIPCDWGKSYIGETGRNINTRLTEHIRCMRKLDSNTSAVAEHALTAGTSHYIRFDRVKVLARDKNFVSRKLLEAIEIGRRPNFNRDKGWSLSPTWDPVLQKSKQKTNDEGDEYVTDIVSTICAPLNNNSNNSGSISSSSTSPSLSPSPPHATATAPPAPPALSSRALRALARSARPDATATNG